MENLSITQWAEEDRPRERLLAHGAAALSNAELLAILIGSGQPGVSAVELMKQVMHDCDDQLNMLGKMSIDDLKAYKGIGEAKAVTIIAACELGKRRQLEEVKTRAQLNSPALMYQLMVERLRDTDVEEAWIILLNQNFRLIKEVRLSHGGISETSVDVRIALKYALLNNATILVLCHNHPSGNTKPSKDDDRLTERFKKACEIMRIHFLDHIIVTDGNYYSYNEHGRL
ncbi:MAG: DNA repair protein RadC [Prevotella sp.]|nr:DNA repair protein RadC [Prevotella sp.]